jgi:branched-subunit amino acid transport protein
MDDTLGLWLVVLAVGVVTFGYRLAFIVLLGRLQLPTLAQRALRFVPVAVLTAIIAPALVLSQGTLDLGPGNPHLVAGVLAVLVAWRTRNMLLTIASGMGALWVLQALWPG